MSCEFGHCWKVTKDAQCCDLGTYYVVHMKCKVCGFKFTWDEMTEQENDYDDLKDVVKNGEM